MFVRLLSRVATWAIAMTLVLGSTRARADEVALTRARVASLARAAPAARAANAEANVARATVTAAGVLSLDNPVLSGLGGLRFKQDGSRPFAGTATIAWPVDLGGKRASRIDAARADQRGADAVAADTKRRLLLAALLQHTLVLRDERQLELTAQRRALAERLMSAAEKHRKAGGVPELDVALASVQLARDTSAEATASGTRDADKLSLLAQLGLQGKDPALAGPLVPGEDPPPLAAMLAAVEQRTDVRAATLELDAARARSGRENASRWPTISVLAQYEYDDRDSVGQVGLAIPLPLLNANRQPAATAAAEVDAARARADAIRAAAAGEVRQLYTRYLATKRAVDALAPASPRIADAIALATRGYELGENNLASVLLVRRETLDAQIAVLDAEQAYASAKIELLVAAGRIPE